MSRVAVQVQPYTIECGSCGDTASYHTGTWELPAFPTLARGHTVTLRRCLGRAARRPVSSDLDALASTAQSW